LVRVVVQRVSRASVSVAGETVSGIGRGLLILVGVEHGDGEREVGAIVDKLANLRLFSDDRLKMNLSVLDVGGEALVVSQFTLLADVRKGRRPSFTGAAAPGIAAPLVEDLVEGLRSVGIHTLSGVFGAAMEVELVNDGPVTLVLDVRNAIPG
jgi:D-tyrosyl-tRNA(Tyr) deacylase